jgi:hypothetical protein
MDSGGPVGYFRIEMSDAQPEFFVELEVCEARFFGVEACAG